MPILRVNAGLSRELYETDFHGRIIDPEKSSTFNISVTNELQLDEGRLSFHVVVKVPRGSGPDLATALAVGWLRRSLPEDIASANYWNFFESKWVTPAETLRDADPNPHIQSEVQIDLTPGLLKQAREAVAHIAAVQAKFEESKARLWTLVTENYPLGFKMTTAEAGQHFRVIEQVLGASADLGGSRPDSARYAMSQYAALGQRKDPNHHNYQSMLESLKRDVYLFNFPTTWVRKPAV